MNLSQRKLVIITGSTAVGKDSILRELRKHPKTDWIVTHTDRPIRKDEGEMDGIDYHFVSKQEFDKMLAENEFAETVITGNSRKGTSKKELLKATNGKTTLWRTDLSRAAKIDSFLNSAFDKNVSSILTNSTSVIIIKTRRISTQRERAIARGLTSKEFEIRIKRDEIPVWNKYKNLFFGVGKWKNFPIKYRVVYNENPSDEKTVNDAISECVRQIMLEIGLER